MVPADMPVAKQFSAQKYIREDHRFDSHYPTFTFFQYAAATPPKNLSATPPPLDGTLPTCDGDRKQYVAENYVRLPS